ETEIFIHGALCVCWSGQCLMSSLIGGRSGNRGRCAQPCRLPYELVDANGKNLLNAGKYLLSPKDLNTLYLLPRLVETGVTSLKIEGRMKRPEYVATVVKVYRDALDKKCSTDEDRRKLAQIFNRDFTTAYLEKNPGKNLISDMKPNNRGVPIGRVAEVAHDKIVLKLSGKISAGDQIEIWIKVGGRVMFTVEDFELRGDLCTIKTRTRGVKVHDRAFKIFDAELTAEARKFFTGAPVRKIPISAEVKAKLGEPLTLTLIDNDGNSATVRTNFIAEPAKNHPLNFETIKAQIGRLGSSIFTPEKISADIDDNLMIPISELNDVRRRAVEQLEVQRLKRLVMRDKGQVVSGKGRVVRGKLKILTPCPVPLAPSIIAHVDTIEKLTAALDAGADEILFGGETFTNQPVKNISEAIELAHKRGKKFSLSTPRIVREGETFTLPAETDSVYVHNLATLRLAKNISAAPIRTDFSLHVFNPMTINFLASLGVEGVTLSPELNLAQIKAIVKKSPLPV
ncbi:MAG: U32 family peptidase, partial [Selenomonadaceae bacterium]|nr:U32 family peptidase [Selenomonadaceae bacterium]